MEDKTFGIEMMNRLLGITPIGLAEGLALTFPAAWLTVDHSPWQ